MIKATRRNLKVSNMVKTYGIQWTDVDKLKPTMVEGPREVGLPC